MSNQSNALVPSSFAAVQAILDQVITRWHTHEADITDWTSTLATIPGQHPAGWAATTETLQLVNTFQWHEEDRSRDHGADDQVLASVKRSIDGSNRRRVQTVDKLDDLIFTGFRQAGMLQADAPLNSESPGSIIDRLSVLALKVYHIREALAALEPGSDEAAAMQPRLDTLAEQSTDLGSCLDTILGSIREGRTGLKLYRQVKVYRDPKTGKLLADLEQ